MAGVHCIGAPGYETENHFAAIRKSEGPEAEKAARAKAAGLPEVPALSDTKSLNDLLALVADPAATRALIERITTASEAARVDREQALAERERLRAQVSEHQAQLDGLQGEHDRRHACERDEHLRKISAGENKLAQRERVLAQREAVTKVTEDKLTAES
jgi:hypothetical protein